MNQVKAFTYETADSVVPLVEKKFCLLQSKWKVKYDLLHYLERIKTLVHKNYRGRRAALCHQNIPPVQKTTLGIQKTTLGIQKTHPSSKKTTLGIQKSQPLQKRHWASKTHFPSPQKTPGHLKTEHWGGFCIA
jgi:hypothetical protein